MTYSFYFCFKRYIKFVHDTFLLRKRFVLGQENLPKEGSRYFIVSNHQNTGNDPLNILFALPFETRMCAMARANLFEIHPWITKFLNWVGMVPAFRFGWEGANGLESNYKSFDKVSEKINQGFPFVVFPEAGHTQGQYIGRFTTGTVRIAFQAAEQNGWKEDIMILPTASHYSNYFEVQIDYLWKVAKPVSLKPYYEEFQQHPNSVMRKLTHQLHDTIQAMMLDEGAEDYEEKDFLRLSSLNLAQRGNMELPERLDADKAFIAKLIGHERYQEIIDKARKLRQSLQQKGIKEQSLAKKPGTVMTFAKTILLWLFLPLWIVLLWPHFFCYALPLLMLKTDRMFTNTYRYVFATLFIYPLCALATILVLGMNFGWWWQALVWIMLWIPTGKMAWKYYNWLRENKSDLLYVLNRKRLSEEISLHDEINKLIN